MLIDRRAALLSALAMPALTLGARGQGLDKIRIGQATTALSFIKIFAARTFDTFAPEKLALEWASIPGGDPATLAAVDSGDLDLAAVGSDTVLGAIGKGQPFKIIYTIIGMLPYDLTVSNAFLAKSGVAPDAPLKDRIAVLKTAVVGVSAVGGAQDRAVRWLAAHGGLNARDVKVALVGGPPALGAALENGRIDAFMLSPPESTIAVVNKYGTVLVRPNRDIPSIRGIPTLVLAAKSDVNAETRGRIVRSLRALNAGAARVLADPDAAADKIGAQFFAKVPPEVVREAVHVLVDGLGGNGQLDAASMTLVKQFSIDSGGTAPQGDDFWTNSYAEAALKG